MRYVANNKGELVVIGRSCEVQLSLTEKGQYAVAYGLSCKQIQENALLSDFFAKQQQLSIYLSDIEKIVFEPVSELLK